MTTLVPPRRRSLAGRLLRVMRSSPLPFSTVELALLVAFDKPNGRRRVWQVLTRQGRLGRVRRLPPLPADGTGRPPFRWVLAGEGGAA